MFFIFSNIYNSYLFECKDKKKYSKIEYSCLEIII